MRICLLPIVYSLTTEEVLKEIENEKLEFLKKNEKIEKNFKQILNFPKKSSFIQLRGGPDQIDVKEFFAEPEKMIQKLSQVNQEIQNMKFK